MSRWCLRADDLVNFAYAIVYCDNSEAVGGILQNHLIQSHYFTAVDHVPFAWVLHHAHHAVKRQVMSCVFNELSLVTQIQAPASLATLCYWGLTTKDMAVLRMTGLDTMGVVSQRTF
eukprot:jgi/Mesvir1/18227/Mv09506-RA.1